MVRFGTQNLMWGWLLFLPFNLRCLNWVPPQIQKTHSAGSCWSFESQLLSNGEEKYIELSAASCLYRKSHGILVCRGLAVQFALNLSWAANSHKPVDERGSARSPQYLHALDFTQVVLYLDWGPTDCSGRGLQFPLINNVCVCLGNDNHVLAATAT